MELTDEARDRDADEDARLACALAEIDAMRDADARAHRRLLWTTAVLGAVLLLLLAWGWP